MIDPSYQMFKKPAKDYLFEAVIPGSQRFDLKCPTIQK